MEKFLFGNRERFAIEFEVEEFRDDWFFGCLYAWGAGQKIGWNDEGGDWAPRGIILGLQEFINDSPRRYIPRLRGMKTQIKYRLLAQYGYVGLGRSGCLEVRLRRKEKRIFSGLGFKKCGASRYCDLMHGFRHFNGVKILVLETQPGKQELIWKYRAQTQKEYERGQVFALELEQGEIERVLMEFVDWAKRFAPPKLHVYEHRTDDRPVFESDPSNR